MITELPYQVSPSSFMVKVTELVNAGELDGIADINDESAQGKTRVVVRL